MDQEALNEFVVESRELLEQAEADLMAFDVESGSVEPEIINRIFRAVHSVKGVAGFFGLDVISKLSHAMESLLMRVRDGEFPLTAEMVDVLLKDIQYDSFGDYIVQHRQAQLQDLQTRGGHLAAAPDKAKPAKKKAATKAEPRPRIPRELAIDDELRTSLIRQGRHLYALTVDAAADLRAKSRALGDYLNELDGRRPPVLGRSRRFRRGRGRRRPPGADPRPRLDGDGGAAVPRGVRPPGRADRGDRAARAPEAVHGRPARDGLHALQGGAPRRRR